MSQAPYALTTPGGRHAKPKHVREGDVFLSPEYEGYTRENYGSGTAKSHAAHSRSHATAKRIGMGAGALAALVIVVAAIYAIWFMQALDQALAPPSEQRGAIDAQLSSASLDEPFYVLALGSDSREGSGADSDVEAYADGQQRSDVMLLVRVDALARQLTLVTIPRDTPYVREDGSVIKINEAYNEGGAAASIKAVSQLTGEPISHYVEVHISELEAIVDSLGGIEMYVDRRMAVNDSLTGERIVLTKGTQTLNGKQAQAFVRVRHAYSDTGSEDGHRQSNVRAFVQAIIKKILDRPVTDIPATVLKLAHYVTTDFTSADLITLASKFSSGPITMYSCSGPIDGAEMEQFGGKWMCYPNPEGWAELMRQVDAGIEPGDIDYASTAITD